MRDVLSDMCGLTLSTMPCRSVVISDQACIRLFVHTVLKVGDEQSNRWDAALANCLETPGTRIAHVAYISHSSKDGMMFSHL